LNIVLTCSYQLFEQVENYKNKMEKLKEIDLDSVEGIECCGNSCTISVDCNEDDSDAIFALIETFCNSPKLSQIKELRIGSWDEAWDNSCAHIIDKLVEKKDQLQHLELLYIGDMDSDECEISWIQQSDLNAIFVAFPNLKHLNIKGSEGLSLGKIKHENLLSLSIYTGGLPSNVLHQLANADLPRLTDLTLWLGEENYGFDGFIDDVVPLLQVGLFPSLTSLGLQNSEIADEIAQAISQNKLQESIKSLNLSMGVLSDQGAELLLTNDSLNQLDTLNVEENFLSDEMVSRLKSEFKIGSILADKQKEDDGYGRYVEVGE